MFKIVDQKQQKAVYVWDVLCNFVPFVKLKNRKKHPWRSANVIKVTLFHGCTESRKASHMIFHKISPLMALVLQFIALILAYKRLEARKNIAIGTYICDRKIYIYRKAISLQKIKKHLGWNMQNWTKEVKYDRIPPLQEEKIMFRSSDI